MWEQWGVEILAFPSTWHIAYTTACGYRTSRDDDEVFELPDLRWFIQRIMKSLFVLKN